MDAALLVHKDAPDLITNFSFQVRQSVRPQTLSTHAKGLTSPLLPVISVGHFKHFKHQYSFTEMGRKRWLVLQSLLL